MNAKSAIALRHIHFETLGTFERPLSEAGYRLTYADVATQDISLIDATSPDLLVVLGGPIGVYDVDLYPFLSNELYLIKQRLDAGLPILGICLGAQLIAAALGARVAATGVKEIGFAPLTLTDLGATSALRHLAGVPVLHWHGDAFDIPAEAKLLATTPIANQAYSIGTQVLGLQFHPEADTQYQLEPWLIGHAAELSSAKIDPRRLREEANEHGSRLCHAGRAMMTEWLNGLC